MYTDSGLSTLLGSGQIVIETSSGAAYQYTLLSGIVQSSLPNICLYLKIDKWQYQ